VGEGRVDPDLRHRDFLILLAIPALDRTTGDKRQVIFPMRGPIAARYRRLPWWAWSPPSRVAIAVIAVRALLAAQKRAPAGG